MPDSTIVINTGPIIALIAVSRMREAGVFLSDRVIEAALREAGEIS